eukprot:m.278577 g.278577  ORF g.278577 m.278577 type:complete len:1066 (-) comp19383_c1_seq3:76-3273(-)
MATPDVELMDAMINSLQQPEQPDPLAEVNLLKQFCIRHKLDRDFSQSPLFEQVFSLLLSRRLHDDAWLNTTSTTCVLHVLSCVRALSRTPRLHQKLVSEGSLGVLARLLTLCAERHMSDRDDVSLREALVEMLAILHRSAADPLQRDMLATYRVHETLVNLFPTSYLTLLHCSLWTLLRLSQSAVVRTALEELDCAQSLLRIIEDGDETTQRQGLLLLRRLCKHAGARESVKMYDGVPVILNLLSSKDTETIVTAVRVVELLAQEFADDIRNNHGLNAILLLLAPDKADGGNDSTVDARRLPKNSSVSSLAESELSLAETAELDLKLPMACCDALAQLSLSDINASLIRELNGIHLIALCMLHRPTTEIEAEDSSAVAAASSDSSSNAHRERRPRTAASTDGFAQLQLDLQVRAVRALRFLFSHERNRGIFQRLFPPDLFGKFIDIGHYCWDLPAYTELVELINGLSPVRAEALALAVNDLNQSKPPSRFVRSYAVLEKLGQGSFGCVYRVRKQGANSMFALKEIPTRNPAAFGATEEEQEHCLELVLTEVKMIQKQLNHPNVVRYYKSFTEGDGASRKLYILMELAEGASLQDHFNSLQEKHQTMPDQRVWHIFCQLCQALRYLHKDQHVMHRDLTPSNIVLDWNDKVKIADFGLARVWRPDASSQFAQSSVGTLQYSCPEVITHDKYDEKADIWALGCLLYQMLTLRVPFVSNNLLTLARKIVEAHYEPIPPSAGRSPLLTQTVSACLMPKPADRPDILQVCSLVAPLLIQEIDRLSKHADEVNRVLETERARRSLLKAEAQSHKRHLHKFVASQDRDDRLEDTTAVPRLAPLPAIPQHRRRRSSSGREGSASSQFSVLPEGGLPTTLERSASTPARAEAPSASISPPSILPDGPNDVFESRPRRRSTSARSRTSSATSFVKMSPRRVRLMVDPISQYLLQVHKLLFVCQLPPSSQQDLRRYVVEKYKRRLFSARTSQVSLKQELQKLCSGSDDVVGMALPFRLGEVFQRDPQRQQSDVDDDLDYQNSDVTALPTDEAELTYSTLCALIEDVLIANGYYQVEV